MEETPAPAAHIQIGHMIESDDGLNLIKEVEGCRLSMYRDQVGIPTIGIGHELTKSERLSGKLWTGAGWADWKDGITEAQALSLLDRDIAIAESAINQEVKVALTQHQFDALTSFVFNVGTVAFGYSTLLKKLNEGDYASVPDQMRRWIYSSGVVVQDLIARREKEISLWQA